MATITKLSNGGFYAQVRLKGHTHQFKKFEKRIDAEIWAERTETELKMQCVINLPDLKKQNLLFVGTQYCATVLKGKSSQHETELRVRRISNLFPLCIDEISQRDVNNYRLLRMQQVKPSTVRDELTLIKRLYKWLNAEHLLGLNNPVEGIVIPAPSKPRDKVVTEEEMKLILAELTPIMSLVIELAFLTGMRRSEIIKLTPANMHLDLRILDVVDGKTGSRSVPLPTKAVELLRRVMEGCSRETSRMFPVAACSVTQALKRARRKLGLSEDIRVHQLRHTRISMVARKGFNNAQIMAVSGHKDVRSVQRYTHLNAIDVVDLLD